MHFGQYTEKNISGDNGASLSDGIYMFIITLEYKIQYLPTIESMYMDFNLKSDSEFSFTNITSVFTSVFSSSSMLLSK